MQKTRKIDLYVRESVNQEFRYYCSTNQSKTLREARAKFQATAFGVTHEVKAAFA